MALTTQFDPIFAKHAGKLPVAFLRALAQRESGMNPREANGARGLLQVINEVRTSFNTKYGTSYTPDDLLNPDINVQIAANLLNMIVANYQRHSATNMRMDWGNPEFVKLVVAGWNSGYSESAGVGHVASYLERRGAPVTHDAVFASAAAAGGTRFLQDPAKRAWQRTVAALYFAQPDHGVVASGGFFLKVLLAGFVAWGAYRLLT